MTALNVSDRVRVRLAPHGLIVLAEYHDRLRDQLPVSMRGLLRPTVADADGLHTFLLWELLAIFGASSGDGFPDVFEDGALHLVPWHAPRPVGTTVRDTTTGATATYVAHATSQVSPRTVAGNVAKGLNHDPSTSFVLSAILEHPSTTAAT